MRANNSDGTAPSPAGMSPPGPGADRDLFGRRGTDGAMKPGASGIAGTVASNDMMPYLTGYFCIALQGVFPPRS